VLREDCSLVDSGLYLSRSSVRVQNSQLLVGWVSMCGFCGWTSKVTLFLRSVSSFESRVWPCWTCQSLVFPGCLRFGLLWAERGQAHQPVSQNPGYTQGWAASFSSSGSQVDSQDTFMSTSFDSEYLFYFCSSLR